MFRFSFLKAITQIIGISLVGIYKIGRDVDDDPFIWNCVVNGQTMDIIMFDQYDILRFQLI